MSTEQANSGLLPLLGPRYWLLWLLFLLLYVITRLPLSIQRQIGKILGKLFYYTGRRRRHIATVNIQLCFPELSQNEQQALVKRHYALFGISLIETFSVWWSDPDLFTDRVTYEGLDNLTRALEKGNGVLLLSGHFTTLEIARPLLGKKVPFDMVYRPHKNLLYERIMSKGRQRWNGKSIDRRNVREMLRRLKSNHAVWYGPDQDYGRKHSVFVPFMDVMAATVTGTSRLAKLSGAPVVPYVIRRTDNYGYHVRVFPELADFPTDDAEQDATRVNQWFEEQIRQQPEDYLWTHRRFKTPPAGQDRPY